MPELRYGGKHGQVIQYEVDPELGAVRTRSKQSFRSGPVPRPSPFAIISEMCSCCTCRHMAWTVTRKRIARITGRHWTPMPCRRIVQ
jgi:hypothetical protein